MRLATFLYFWIRYNSGDRNGFALKIFIERPHFGVGYIRNERMLRDSDRLRTERITSHNLGFKFLDLRQWLQ
jgi:hypothetical protein